MPLPLPARKRVCAHAAPCICMYVHPGEPGYVLIDVLVCVPVPVWCSSIGVCLCVSGPMLVCMFSDCVCLSGSMYLCRCVCVYVFMCVLVLWDCEWELRRG